jgi:hypothetical protein
MSFLTTPEYTVLLTILNDCPAGAPIHSTQHDSRTIDRQQPQQMACNSIVLSLSKFNQRLQTLQFSGKIMSSPRAAQEPRILPAP